MKYVIDWSVARIQRPSSFSADGTGGSILALGRGSGEKPPPPGVGRHLIKFRAIDRAAYGALQAYGAYAADSPLAIVLHLPAPPTFWPVRGARYVAAFEARFGVTDDPFLVYTFWVLHGVFAILYLTSRVPILVAAALTLCIGYAWLRQRVPRYSQHTIYKKGK